MDTVLLDGIRKNAVVTSEDVRGNVPITKDMEEFIKSLRSGDILLSKGAVKGDKLKDKVSEFMNKYIYKQYPWGHGGIYGGEKNIHHMYYAPMKERPGIGKQIRTAQGRTHLLETLRRQPKQDFLALRPKGVTDKEQERAVELAKKMMGRRFNLNDYVQSGLLFPGKSSGRMKGGMPTKAMCSGMAASAYPDYSFKDDRASRFVRPSDLFTSDKLKQIIALSTGEQ